MSRGTWTVDELQALLHRYEDELRRAGLTEKTIRTYVDHPARYFRWLTGDYKPGDR